MKKVDKSTLLGQMFALKPGTDKMLMEVFVCVCVCVRVRVRAVVLVRV